MKRLTLAMGLRILSLLFFTACVAIAFWGMKQGLFSSQQTMEYKISGLGVLGLLLFILLQIVQVVIPIIPGGVSLQQHLRCILEGRSFGFLRLFWRD